MWRKPATTAGHGPCGCCVIFLARLINYTHFMRSVLLGACRLLLYDFIYHRSHGGSSLLRLLLLLPPRSVCSECAGVQHLVQPVDSRFSVLLRRFSSSPACACIYTFCVITFYCPLYKLLAFALAGMGSESKSEWEWEYRGKKYPFTLCVFGMQHVSKFVQRTNKY